MLPTFTRISTEAGELADMILGVQSVGLGFVGTVYGIYGGFRESYSEGMIMTARRHALRSTFGGCR